MSRLKKGGAVAVLAVSLVGGFEGIRLNAYPDPATRGHPWTICYGSTEGVKPGDKKSLDECKALLVKELDAYADKVEACIKRPMSDETEVAFLSLAYNIGTGGFCKSSVARLYNAGDGKGACDAMLRFNRAAGVVFPGLTKRRVKERQLCLSGL
jgi:lysozyme